MFWPLQEASAEEAPCCDFRKCDFTCGSACHVPVRELQPFERARESAQPLAA